MDIEVVNTKQNKQSKNKERSQSKNKNKKVTTKSTDQFKTKAEEFKHPKNSKNIYLERREDRLNREGQMRKNKINDYILKTRGLLDSDASDTSLNMSSKSFLQQSQSKNMSLTNLTGMIDTTTYKVPPKLCAVVALNSTCNLDLIMKNFEEVLKEELEKGGRSGNTFYKQSDNMWTSLVPPSLFKGKERISLIKTERDVYSILDTCKVVDIIMFVSSCKETEYTKWKTDPDKYAHSIDEFGYQILSMLRAQGLPQHICVIQDLNTIPDKHKSDIKKLFTRYFESELKPDKIFSLSGGSSKSEMNEEESLSLTNKDEYKAAIRLLCAVHPFQVSLDIRKHRSYMLCERHNLKENSELELFGYIRGNTLNVNNYIHLTGFGDYLVTGVDLETDPCVVNAHHPISSQNSRKNSGMEIENSNTTTNNSTKKQNNKENIDDKVENINSHLNTDNKPHVIGKEILNPPKNKMIEDDDIDFDIQIKDDDEDLSFDENEDQFDEEEEGRISKKHINKTSIKYRTDDEMEFPDEVDTPIDIPARERFSKYRGLASMKQGSWDPLEGLPKEYANIYSFENLRYLYKLAVKKAHDEGMKISGSYVKITIKNFNKDDLVFLKNDTPLVLSSLLDYERKLCVMHYKISLNYENNTELKPKQTVETQCGFRRILAQPIFSSEIGGGINDKLKIEKKLEKDKFYFASVYSQLTYPNSPVLFFRPSEDSDSTNRIFVAFGNTVDTDSKKVILKRIILTGYPLKIKKKKAVVRYMFFNPNDVHYFKPVQLVTKVGLRGHITESLGTHGHMKCIFNDHIKANDTVCLHLYKRVFPKWFKESWKYKVYYGNRNDYKTYFEKEKEEKILEENTNLNTNLNMNID